MAAEGVNWRKPRFVLKTKDVRTRTAPHEEGTHFQDVRDYHALIEAFLPRLLIDDQVRAAPDGIYCWLLREKEGERHVYAMKVISEQEIGSLHNFIFILTSDRSHPLTFEERFVDAAQVLAAGELRVREGEAMWNLQSGSFMEPIFGIKSLALVKPRTYKTAAQLRDEVAAKRARRDALVQLVSDYVPGHFAEVALPAEISPFRNAGVSEYVGNVSAALGGESFLSHDDPILTSENNMGMLRELLSTDGPKRKAHDGGARTRLAVPAGLLCAPIPPRGDTAFPHTPLHKTCRCKRGHTPRRDRKKQTRRVKWERISPRERGVGCPHRI